MVNERYKRYLILIPVERLKLEFTKDEETGKEEYSKVKVIIMETPLKAIPKDLATEATQNRLDEPMEVMLTIMARYQPGSRKEK